MLILLYLNGNSNCATIASNEAMEIEMEIQIGHYEWGELVMYMSMTN